MNFRGGITLKYSIDVNASKHIIGQALDLLDKLTSAVDKADSAKSTASSALQYSPSSNAAANTYLEDFLSVGIKGAQGLGYQNASCTVEAINSFTDADATMSNDSRCAAGSVPTIDAPGA